MTSPARIEAGGDRLQLRPTRAGDVSFLFELYASTRADELDLTGWDAATRATFLEMQFSAQHTHYTTHYPEAQFDIIEWDGDSVGRVYVRRTGRDLVLMDIALMPAFRGRGLGSRILQALVDEAAATARTITLHVEINNPRAHAWYRRFGFVDVETTGVHILMRLDPASPPPSST